MLAHVTICWEVAFFMSLKMIDSSMMTNDGADDNVCDGIDDHDDNAYLQ